MTVSSRSDSPTVPTAAATQDTKMASTEETAEGPAVSEGTVSPRSEDKHDDEPTTSNDRIPDDDQHVSRDSEHVEDSSDDDDNDDEDEDDQDDEDGKASSSDESPTSVADDIPEGDSNADLHALLAFSKIRLDTVKPVPDESQQDNNTKSNDEEEDHEDEAQNEDKEEQQEEKKEEDDEEGDGDQTKETNDVAAAEKTAQDVPDETVGADDNDGSNADASKAKADDEATAAAKMDCMSSKEAAAKASQAGEDSNKELWALLSYSKQRLETGAHAGQKKDKKKSGSSRKKRSSSIGTSGSMKSPLTSPTASPARNPRKSDAAAADTDMEELHLDGGDNTTGNAEDDDGQHSRESVASETLRDEDADGSEVERVDDDVVEEEYSNDEEEELSSDEEGSEVGSFDEGEESDDDSTGGIPATPAFLRQLEETDKEDPDSTDAKMMSDAARSYADAILSVADEKTTGDLTDEQMLEAMCVAEAAAAAGEEQFTTSIAKLRLHEAKEASKKMAASMKEEVEKAAKTAKAAKDRQVARQNKFFSGKRPAGQWIKGKMKEFQETCAKVDGGQP